MSKKQNQPAPSSSIWTNDLIVASALALGAFLLYAKTIGFDYALDDRAVTYENAYVKQGFAGFSEILSTFYWHGHASFVHANSGLFRPLSLLLFAVEWQFAPNSPHFYHFIQVLLYALTVAVLYRFLRDLFRDLPRKFSVAIAVLFLLHTSHTEVVANIKSADEILALLFSLLAMRSLLRWSDDASIKSLALTAGYFFLALLSKEGAATLLPVLILLPILLRNKTWKDLLRPAVALGGVVVVWLLWHNAVISGAADPVETYTYHHNTLVAASGWNERIGTALSIFSMYVGKLFWPSPLSYDYSFSEIKLVGLGDPLALLGLALIGLLAFVTVKYFRRYPIPVIGVLIFGCSIALTSNLFVLIGATMADRFLFVPSLGFCIALVWALAQLDAKKILGSEYFFVGSVSAFGFLFLFLTWARTSDWADEATLFTADVEHAPGSARVHFNYGTLLLGQAQNTTDQLQKDQLLKTAVSHFQQAYQIDSLDAQSCYNLGVAYFRMKDYSNSLRWSRAVRKITPQDKSILSNMGDAFTMNNDFDSAIVYLKQTIANGIIYKDTRNFLGYCYLNKRDTVQALATFREAIAADSTYVDAWLKYANVSGMHHDFSESNKAFERALQLRPEDPSPLKMIATNYLMQKDTVKAQEYFSEYQKRGGK